MRTPSSLRGLIAFSTVLRLTSLVLANANAGASPNQYSPFANPLLDRDYIRPDDVNGALIRRGDCPSDYNSCSSIGGAAAGICCQSSQTCSLDYAGQVACCPIGDICTGVIGTGTAVVTGSTFSQTTSGVFTTTASTTTGLLTASTTVGVTLGAASTVPNAPYPFVYIPTTFADPAVCSSYYTQCQEQFVSCTSYLESGQAGNAVTISGVTGLVTVAGATTTVAAADAPSICSALSTTACYQLQLGYCAQVTAASGPVATVGAAPRITGCAGGLYMMGAGVALGVAGAIA